MSNVVMAWVKQHVVCDPLDKWVLAMIADEAEDDGYQSGSKYVAVNHLAQVTCMDRKTVMRAIMRHEDAGQLLVRRPAERGHGRHNEYIVLMGRAPGEAAADRGWAQPPNEDRSPGGTYPGVPSPESPSAQRAAEPAADRAVDLPESVRDAQAVPPVALQEQPAVAVDGDVPPLSDRSPTGTYSGGTGPGPVQDRSRVERDSEHFPCTPRPKVPAGRAREAGSVDDDPLTELAGALSAAGHSVRWDLTLEQAGRVLEHLARWPSIGAGLDAFTAAADAGVRAHGLPRSARAWIPPWLELVPPKPRSVQLPPAPCPKPEHSGEPIGADGTCVLCKADARVGDRT